MKAISKDFAASMLLDALYTTDDIACAKYGISTRSLRRWRIKLATDKELSALVTTKKRAFDAAWADELPVALRKSLQTLSECFDEIRKDAELKKQPSTVAALAGAVKICAEVQLTGKVIDARIIGQDRPETEVFGAQSADAPSGEYSN